MLPPSLEFWRDYYREARPAEWLLPGRNRVDPVSTRQFKALGMLQKHLGQRQLPAAESALSALKYGLQAVADHLLREAVIVYLILDHEFQFSAFGHTLGGYKKHPWVSA